ncbi:hypothetical protein ACWCL1_03715 [Ligilactobacillus sp. LYQ135]
MKKFLFRFLLVSGTLAGIAYLKKDQILDALIKYSIDVSRLNNSVDDVIDKSFTLKDKITQAKKTFSDAKEDFSDLSNDITNYTNNINPIVENIKKDLDHE